MIGPVRHWSLLRTTEPVACLPAMGAFPNVFPACFPCRQIGVLPRGFSALMKKKKTVQCVFVDRKSIHQSIHQSLNRPTDRPIMLPLQTLTQEQEDSRAASNLFTDDDDDDKDNGDGAKNPS